MAEGPSPLRGAARGEPSELLSAREAVAFLEVKPATLYTYVSRGLLISVPRPGSRGRYYRIEDLTRLKARRLPPPSAGRGVDDEPPLRTIIPALVAQLVHTPIPADRREEALCVLLDTSRVLALLDLADAPLLVASRVGLVVWSLRAPSVPKEAMASSDARALLQLVAALFALRRGAEYAERAIREAAFVDCIAWAWATNPAELRSSDRASWLARALAVVADRALDGPAFAVRAAARAGAGLAASVLTGIDALSGTPPADAELLSEDELAALGGPREAVVPIGALGRVAALVAHALEAEGPPKIVM